MSECEKANEGPVFRANKRRRVLRKRTVTDGDEIEGIEAGNEDTPEKLARVPKPRKYGVAFTCKGAWRVREEEASIEMAAVPRIPDEVQEVVGNDRFVKSTGKTVVIEDKHMLAYVDSKLAERRSHTSTPNSANEATAPNGSHPIRKVDGSSRQQANGTSEDATAEVQLPSAPPRPNQPTTGPPPHQSRHQSNSRRRRPPAERDHSALVRDTLIDQIMRESTLPIYEPQSHGATPVPQTDSTIDNDAAAVEAFKAEYLASVQEKKRLMPPKPASLGPKLGGSRQQRERMKAAEEAKAASGKK